MQARNPQESTGDRPRQNAPNGQMRPVSEVMDLLESQSDRGGRWLWRDCWVEA